MQWTTHGIFAAYVDGTAARLVRFAATGAITPLNCQGLSLAGDFHVGGKGDLGFIGANAERFTEAYFAEPASDGTCHPRQLSHTGDAIKQWQLGTVETIRWVSKEGTEMEG